MEAAQPGALEGFPTANWLLRGRIIHAGYPGAWDEGVAASIRQAVERAKVSTIVNFLSDAEIESLPPYLGGLELPPACLNARPISWIHHPVADGGTAEDDELRALIERCLASLAGGGILLVHCLGGHGRSGVLCACLAGALLGLSASDALALVKTAHDLRDDPWARQHMSPETTCQRQQVELSSNPALTGDGVPATACCCSYARTLARTHARTYAHTHTHCATAISVATALGYPITIHTHRVEET